MGERRSLVIRSGPAAVVSAILVLTVLLARDSVAAEVIPTDTALDGSVAPGDSGATDGPDAGARDAAPADAAPFDAAAADAAAADAMAPDAAAAADAAETDAVARDADAPDAMAQDALAADAAAADAAAADSATPDAGASDASNPDASPPDADPRATVGAWDDIAWWPIVAIDAALLPNGLVLAFPRNHDQQAVLWDPIRGTFDYYPNVTTDLFCSSHSFLPDGRLFLTGGRGFEDGVGLPDTNIYDYRDNSWSLLPPMNAGRWYPTNVTLPNGNVLVVAGTIDNVVGTDLLPQVFSSTIGAWRNLDNAQRELSVYPWLFVAPNGMVFSAGPDQSSLYLDTRGRGQWSDPIYSNFGYRDYGTSVMYGDGKILIAGGHDPPTATAEVIDLQDPNPTWRNIAPMAFARRQVNSVLLPDGTVLVLGGTSSGGFNRADAAVLAVELWNPVTESWTFMAPQAEPRLYHSTAWLLPDGRVVSAGGGQPAADGIDDDHYTAQIYSPPYLFKGSRPRITSAPASVVHGASFVVSTPDAIASVSLIRLSSVTHSFNTDQRIARPVFAPVDGGVRVDAPSDLRRAPPGYYLLFLLNAQGVPSQASTIQIL